MHLLVPPITFAQETSSSPAVAEVERVIVTGSNIPTAEEVGPNPVFSNYHEAIHTCCSLSYPPYLHV
jgi:hypothetical protein